MSDFEAFRVGQDGADRFDAVGEHRLVDGDVLEVRWQDGSVDCCTVRVDREPFTLGYGTSSPIECIDHLAVLVGVPDRDRHGQGVATCVPVRGIADVAKLSRGTD